MDGWDIALLAAAGYLAITALVRLMVHRRGELMAEFREEMSKQKRRKRARRRAEDARRSRAA